MIHHMDDKNQGASKKTIQVRKPRTSPNTSTANINYDDDHCIPVAMNDSQWNGIKFTVPKDENIEHTQCTTDDENEVKVIELENVENPPLFLLFPELKSEELNFQNILNQEVSTADVTKMLVGKKPNLALLKPCKKLGNRRCGLSPVEELSESEEYLDAPAPIKKKSIYLTSSTCLISPIKNSSSRSLEINSNHSSEADVSNNERESTF